MIEELKNLNQKLIEKNKDNPEELNKQQLISQILNVKNCFMKINVEHAYAVLRDLGFEEQDLKGVYLKLLDNI